MATALGTTRFRAVHRQAQASFRNTGPSERTEARTLDFRLRHTQTLAEMRTRIAVAAVLFALGGWGLYAAAASGTGRIAGCSFVRVSGGDFNAATGGQAVAAVGVRNLGKRDCTISGRPWIRFGALRHGVTVADATHAVFGSLAGVSGRVLTLRPGQHAYADILIQPGSCGLARSEVFTLRAGAGWARRGVPIGDLACKNGTAEIWVGSFRR